MTKSEAAIEKEFVDYVYLRGGLALKLLIAGKRGFPDRTCLLPGGRVIFIEFKKPGGRLSFHQKMWISKLKGLGFTVTSTDDLQTAKDFIDVKRI